MNVYLPKQKVLFIAENCAGTLHNALTPRGAQVRDLLAWAGFLDETIVTFSDMEIVCSAHNWPHFGREESIRFIGIQRDMYRYVNNATLHLVNLGYTIDEVGRMVSGEDGTMPLPEEFAQEWCSHGFYGTYNHDAKAVYQRYIGWDDGKSEYSPVHLYIGILGSFGRSYGHRHRQTFPVFLHFPAVQHDAHILEYHLQGHGIYRVICKRRIVDIGRMEV